MFCVEMNLSAVRVWCDVGCNSKRDKVRERESPPCAKKRMKKRRGIISKRQKRFDHFFFAVSLFYKVTKRKLSLSLSLSLYCFHRSRSHPRTHSTDEKRRRRRRIYKTLAGNRGGVEMNSHSSLRKKFDAPPLSVNRK